MADKDLSINLKGNADSFTSAIQKAVADFKTGMQGVEATSAGAKKALDSAFSTLNVKPFQELQAEAIKVKEAFNTIYMSAGASGQDVSNAAKAMKASLADIDAQMKGNKASSNALGDSLSSLKGQVLAAVTAFAGFAALKTAFDNIIREGSEAEQQVLKLSSALGGGSEAMAIAKDKLSGLGEEANRLGQDNDALANNYIKLTLAAKGTASAGAIVETSFKAVNDIQGALGLSTEQTASITDLLARAFSKGSISARELRGVLLQSGLSMEAFAAASGKSMAELKDDLKDGTLSAEEFANGLKHIADVDLAGQSGNFAKTFDGQMQILKNSVADFFQAIAESGALTAFKEKIQGTIDTFKSMSADGSLQKYAEGIGSAIGSLIELFVKVTKVVVTFKDSIAVLVAIGAALWLANTAKAIIAFTTVTEASTGAVIALNLALKASLVGLAAVVGYEIGTWINDNFLTAKKGVKEATTEIEKFNEELKKIKGVDMSKAFGDISTNVATQLKEIDKAYADTAKAVIVSDKSAADAFTASMQSRIKNQAEVNKQYTAQENQLAIAQKQLAQDKAQLETKQRAEAQAQQQEQLQKTIASEATKNGALLTAEKSLEASKQQLADLSNQKLSKDALKAAQESAKWRIDQEQKVVDAIKQTESQISANDKVNNELRAIESKKATDKIANQEAALKAQVEQLKDQKLAVDRKYVADSEASFTKRALELQNLEFVITENAASHARQRAEIERTAIDQRVEVIRANSAKIVAETDRINHELVQKSIDKLQAEIRTGAALFESHEGFLKRIEASEKATAQVLKDAAISTSNKIIATKQAERDAIKGLLDKQLSDVEAHNAKIKEANDKLAGITKSYADEEFGVSLKRMSDGEKYVALQARILQSVKEMQDIRALAQQQDGGATDKQIKQLEALETQARGYNTELEGLGKTSSDSAVSATQATSTYLANNKLLKDVSVGMVEDTKKLSTAFVEMATKSGGSIETTAIKLRDLDIQLGKLKDMQLDLKATVDLSEVIVKTKKLRDMAEEGFNLTAKVDDTAAKAEIAQLTKTETKTIIVNEVKGSSVSGSSGGDSTWYNPTYMMADGGAVTGAGTATSDSIPSLLSNGEYVIRAASVQKWGKNFFDNLNRGTSPPIRGFAIGGLVGADAANSSKNDTVNISISLGNKAFMMQGARETAMNLASALQVLSRAA